MSEVVESALSVEKAIYRQVIEAGCGFSRTIKKGQIVRIVDLEANQAVDTVFYNAADPTDRYSAADTIQRQKKIYLTTGTKLISTEGNELLTIVADTCGRHDTLGGACSAAWASTRSATKVGNRASG